MTDLAYEIHIEDSIIKRNYEMVGKYFISLVDDGLDFLKTIYVKNRAENSFQEFAAENYYEYILRDYLRRKIRVQIKYVLKGAVLSLEHFNNNTVDPDFLDNLVAEIIPDFQEYDLTIIHTDHEHVAYQELKVLSKLTYRLSVIQVCYLLRNRDSEISNVQELIQQAFPTIKEGWNSVNVLFTMFDQIIDIFERNLDLIEIAFYKPTFKIRNIFYTRNLMEYAITKIREELQKIYGIEKEPAN
jgi:hypothetical protein